MSALTCLDLNREFESCSLRHSVWIAENLGSVMLEILRIRRISLNSSAELDCRESPTPVTQGPFCAFFSGCPKCSPALKCAGRLSTNFRFARHSASDGRSLKCPADCWARRCSVPHLHPCEPCIASRTSIESVRTIHPG